MKLSLEIAFFGPSIVSAFRNGSATYFRGIVRALAARGHRITFFEPRIEGRQKHRDMPDPLWADVVVHSGTDANDLGRVLEQARRADVVVKASNVGVFDDVLEREIPRSLKPGATSIFVGRRRSHDARAARTGGRARRLRPRLHPRRRAIARPTLRSTWRALVRDHRACA